MFDIIWSANFRVMSCGIDISGKWMRISRCIHFHNWNICLQLTVMTPATPFSTKMCPQAKHFYWMSRKVRVTRGEVRLEKLRRRKGGRVEQRWRRGRGGGEEWVRTNHRRRERERKHSLFPASNSQSTELEMLEATERLLSYKHSVRPAGREKLSYAKENRVSQNGNIWGKRREKSAHIWALTKSKLGSAASLWRFPDIQPDSETHWNLSADDTYWYDSACLLFFFLRTDGSHQCFGEAGGASWIKKRCYFQYQY